MSNGWIYLKKMTDHNGNPTAYCFGLTSRPEERKRAYRKENPFIVHLEDYLTSDMKAAEDELIVQARLRRWLLRDNSDEWIKAECFDDFKITWNRVKDKYSVQGVRKRKAAKRKRRQAVHGMDVIGAPITQKQKRDRDRDFERRRLLDEAAAKRQQEHYKRVILAAERENKVAATQSIASTRKAPLIRTTQKNIVILQAVLDAAWIGCFLLLGILALFVLVFKASILVELLGVVGILAAIFSLAFVAPMFIEPKKH